MTHADQALEQEEPQIVAPGTELVTGYEVVSHLRRGHRLDVYDVWSLDRRARCIAKLVRPDRVGERHTWVSLRNEGRLLRDLSHPHLVRAYEVIETPQTVVIMETLTGPTLADVLHEHGCLAPPDVARLGAQLASALRYLHRHDCVHGDLTSGNVVLEAGIAKVIDLSLSGPPGPVRAGSGTRGFRSPEQSDGTAQSPATDVWGLGAVLHRALKGRTYDDPPGRTEGLRARLWDFGGRRGPLTDLVAGCLRKRPEDRLSLDELSEVLNGLVALREP